MDVRSTVLPIYLPCEFYGAVHAVCCLRVSDLLEMGCHVDFQHPRRPTRQVAKVRRGT